MKLDEAYILAEENLTEKEINKAEEDLDDVIALIETGKNDPSATNGKFSILFSKELSTLCSKYWTMKELTKKLPVTHPSYQSAQKANRIWLDRLHPKLSILNNIITEWNKNHPDNQLPSIKELCGFDLRASINTEK